MTMDNENYRRLFNVVNSLMRTWVFALILFHVDYIRIVMMTSSNGIIFPVTGLLCGEFTGPGEFPTQRPVTRSFDVFFDLRLNKRLSKQPWGWWFEMPSLSLWRQCNGEKRFVAAKIQFCVSGVRNFRNNGVCSSRKDTECHPHPSGIV